MNVPALFLPDAVEEGLDIFSEILVASLGITIIISFRVFVVKIFYKIGYGLASPFFTKKKLGSGKNISWIYLFLCDFRWVFCCIVNFLVCYWLFIKICSETLDMLDAGINSELWLIMWKIIFSIILLALSIICGVCIYKFFDKVIIWVDNFFVRSHD